MTESRSCKSCEYCTTWGNDYALCEFYGKVSLHDDAADNLYFCDSYSREREE